LTHRVWLGLGSNVGDRLSNLRQALRLLESCVRIDSVSSLYETDPVGVTDQPAFYNAVCSGETELEPEPLLDAVKQIEWELGRRPGLRWGPRPLDIDILLFDDLRLESPRLQIPHARLAERAFVLCPLADLAAQKTVPGVIGSIQELLASSNKSGVRLAAGAGWESQPEL
jgi:2-amino-4-hydroxy-6-hydroxymethyldihydropteridine diphosphokinase